MEEKKFCKFCGEQIEKDSIVCLKCGRQLKVVKKDEKKQMEEDKKVTQKKFYEQQWFMWVMLIFFSPVGIFFMWKFNDNMKKNTKIILSIVFGIIFLIMISSSSEEPTNNNSSTENGNNNSYIEENIDNNNNDNKTPATNNDGKNKYTLGDTIIFDDLELTFDKEYTFATIDNQFSDYHRQSAIKIGVNIKNISLEKNHLNTFYYDFFGSQGNELDNVQYYFDDSVADGGDLKSGASYKKYFYVLYDGNGTYSIDFDNYSQEISVEFEIVE